MWERRERERDEAGPELDRMGRTGSCEREHSREVVCARLQVTDQAGLTECDFRSLGGHASRRKEEAAVNLVFMAVGWTFMAIW